MKNTLAHYAKKNFPISIMKFSADYFLRVYDKFNSDIFEDYIKNHLNEDYTKVLRVPCPYKINDSSVMETYCYLLREWSDNILIFREYAYFVRYIDDSVLCYLVKRVYDFCK